MCKKTFIVCLISLTISSCASVEEVRNNIHRYKRLTRDHQVTALSFTKHANSIKQIKFLVANYPDQVIHLDGKGFNKRYQKLINYLKNSNYTVMISEKLPMVATVIARINKPTSRRPGYIGIAMQQNIIKQQTDYNIFYGSDKFKALKLYNSYKKTLCSTTRYKS